MVYAIKQCDWRCTERDKLLVSIVSTSCILDLFSLFFGEIANVQRVTFQRGIRAAVFFDPISFADDEDAGRRIEEIVVYGERVESIVQDNSASITAMDTEFLSDTSILGLNEMVNFIPATTRTDWDVKIRGVGRNFPGLAV